MRSSVKEVHHVLAFIRFLMLIRIGLEIYTFQLKKSFDLKAIVIKILFYISLYTFSSKAFIVLIILSWKLLLFGCSIQISKAPLKFDIICTFQITTNPFCSEDTLCNPLCLSVLNLIMKLWPTQMAKFTL